MRVHMGIGPTVLFVAGAIGMMAALPSAMAQDYRPDYGSSNLAPGEEVLIEGPSRHEHGQLGGPIERVSLSRAVRYDDLNLRTRWGVRKLRSRIVYTAHSLCRQLDKLYPLSTDYNPPCYTAAVENAMYQADTAIAYARR